MSEAQLRFYAKGGFMRVESSDEDVAIAHFLEDVASLGLVDEALRVLGADGDSGESEFDADSTSFEIAEGRVTVSAPMAIPPAQVIVETGTFVETLTAWRDFLQSQQES